MQKSSNSSLGVRGGGSPKNYKRICVHTHICFSHVYTHEATIGLIVSSCGQIRATQDNSGPADNSGQAGQDIGDRNTRPFTPPLFPSVELGFLLWWHGRPSFLCRPSFLFCIFKPMCWHCCRLSTRVLNTDFWTQPWAKMATDYTHTIYIIYT